MRPLPTVRASFISSLLIGIIHTVSQQHAQASDTNVFTARSSLQATAFTLQGVKPVRLKNDVLLLGTNAAHSVLGIAVSDANCQPGGPQPDIRLVAYNRSTHQIVADLVEFTEVAPIFIGDKMLIMQAHGEGRSGLDAASLDALITFGYEACTATNAPLRPTRVSIQPLGTVKPNGSPAFPSPITPDVAELLITSDDPRNPNITLSLDGTGATATPSCNITLTPSSLTLPFGNVLLGTNATLTVNLRNNGGVSCTVTSLTLNGSSAFTLVGAAVPITIAAGNSTNLTLTFSPLITGSDHAVFGIASTDPVNPVQYLALNGTGQTTTACQIGAGPLHLDFGSVQQGTNRTMQVIVTNSGGSTCGVDNVTLVTQSPDFSVSHPTLPFPVVPGTSQVVTVTYTPSGTTAATGTLELDTQDPANRLILVSLTATGIAATCSITVGPAELDYGAVIVGTNRAESISFTNNGLIACSIASITSSGSTDFAIVPAPSLPIAVPTGGVVNLVAEFAPTGGGDATNKLTIVTGSGTNVVTLVGLGVGLSSNCTVAVSKSSLDFGNVAVSEPNVLKVQVSNASLSNCTLQRLILSGSSDFTVIAPPQPILLPGAGLVEVGIRYIPSSAAADAGTLQIVTDDPLNPIFTVSLTGTGVVAHLVASTNAVNFGALPVLSSTAAGVIVSNASIVNCTISSVGIAGSADFTLSPLVPTSRFILQPGGVVAIPMTYLPSQTGTGTATLVVASDDPASPLTVALTGVGLRCNLTVTPVTIDFGGIVLGRTNTITLTLGNTGNTNCTVESLEVFGSGRFTLSGPATPFPVAPGSNVNVQVEYVPANEQTIMILGGSVRSTGKPQLVTP